MMFDRFGFKSLKTKLIVFLLCLGLFLGIKDRDFIFLFSMCACIASAVLSESLISYVKTKALHIGESPVITGLIVSFVLSADEGLWRPIAACILAIFLKNLIRFNKRHVFNPATLGIFIATVLLGAHTQWKGTYLWYVLVPAGIYFASRINKIDLLTGYAVVSVLLFGCQALLQKAPLTGISGYFSLFFIFIMLIEPKTTPIKKSGKYIYGAMAALLIFILTSLGVGFDVELLSLLVVNCTVPFLNKI